MMSFLHLFKYLVEAMAILLVLTLFFMSPAWGQKTYIYSASSLNSVLNEIISDSKMQDRYSVVSGSSSILAKQIINGAPSDIYISAHEKWINYLSDKNIILKDEDCFFTLKNKLVFVTSSNHKIESLKEFANKAERLAMADYNHVPLGEYAYQILLKMKLWDSLKDRFVLFNSARSTLMPLLNEELNYGIIYKSDYHFYKDRLFLIETLSQKIANDIAYKFYIIDKSKNEEINRFIHLIQSDRSRKIFKKYGFFK